MDDLKTQLLTYVDEVVERVDIDDVLTGSSVELQPARRKKFPGWAVGFSTAILIVLIGVLSIWVFRGDSSPVPPVSEPSITTDTGAPPSVIAIPPPSECGQADPPRAVSVDGTLHRSAVGSSSIWVSDWDTATLTQVDLTSLCIVADLTVGEPFSSVIDLAADGGRVWVADFSTGSVQEVDDDGTVSRTIPNVRAGSGMVVDGPSLYVACCGIGEGTGEDPITRIDTDTGEVTLLATVDWPSAITVDHGSLWVGSYVTNRVVRIDLATGRSIATIDLPDGIISDIAATEDHIWAVSGSHLIQIDPASNRVTDQLDIPGIADDDQVSIEARPDGLLWLYGSQLEPILINPADGAIIARMEARPQSIKSTDGGLLVTEGNTLAILED